MKPCVLLKMLLIGLPQTLLSLDPDSPLEWKEHRSRRRDLKRLPQSSHVEDASPFLRLSNEDARGPFDTAVLARWVPEKPEGLDKTASRVRRKHSSKQQRRRKHRKKERRKKKQQESIFVSRHEANIVEVDSVSVDDPVSEVNESKDRLVDERSLEVLKMVDAPFDSVQRILSGTSSWEANRSRWRRKNMTPW